MECWLGGFVIFQGIPTSIAKEPYIFIIFQGGGGSGKESGVTISVFYDTIYEQRLDQHHVDTTLLT